MHEKGQIDTYPLISIVMPAYGVENYIAAAIDDVRSQSFKDWELIIVDDASPDSSCKIARSYTEIDPRIRIVSHEANRGLSAARNTGIAAARGTYIWMPDPDDTYDCDLLARAVAGLDHTRLPDLILFGHVEDYYDSNGTYMYTNVVSMPQLGFLDPKQWHELVMEWERDTHLGYAWNKLYRLQRIHECELSFENVRLIEDIDFNIRFLKDAHLICVVGGEPYHYAKREGISLTNANAYGASEYWHLHERRVRELFDLFSYWDVLFSARPILGGIYVRYIVSTLERSYHEVERWSAVRRRQWLIQISRTDLYKELVGAAQADSRLLSITIRALRRGSLHFVIAIARLANLTRTHAYGLFTRARNRR